MSDQISNIDFKKPETWPFYGKVAIELKERSCFLYEPAQIEQRKALTERHIRIHSDAAEEHRKIIVKLEDDLRLLNEMIANNYRYEPPEQA